MNFDEVWERICNVLRWRKLGDMADFLGIKSQSVSGAKSRGVFPIEWAFKIGQEHGLSTEWILTGKGIGGPGNTIDEDFFIRVAFAVETILQQRQLELSLWQKLRLYTYIYEDAISTIGTIDPEMIKRVISLTATNAVIVEEDKKIIELINQLSAGVATDNERIKLADNWFKKISDKYIGAGLLSSLGDKGKVVAWLETELRSQQTKSGDPGKAT